ncbi:hypothetical protein ATP21_25810 [Salmonella enterica]|nr:hypothetical protein [Salmonella enterica]
MHIQDFPEVYHGQGISEAVFLPLRAGSQERYITQYLVARLVDYDATSCVIGLLRVVVLKEDPTPGVSGSV